jgi:hypothetical protein
VVDSPVFSMDLDSMGGEGEVSNAFGERRSFGLRVNDVERTNRLINTNGPRAGNLRPSGGLFGIDQEVVTKIPC